jgi:flagellar biosynthesis protein FliR
VAYEEFRKKVVHLQSDVNLFETFFLDRDEFKRFADNLRAILVTGIRFALPVISLRPLGNRLEI